MLLYNTQHNTSFYISGISPKKQSTEVIFCVLNELDLIMVCYVLWVFRMKEDIYKGVAIVFLTFTVTMWEF